VAKLSDLEDLEENEQRGLEHSESNEKKESEGEHKENASQETQKEYFQIHPPCYNRDHGLILPLKYKSGGAFLPPLPFVDKIRVCVNGFNVDTYLQKSGMLKMMRRLFEYGPNEVRKEDDEDASNRIESPLYPPALHLACISYANHSEKVLLNSRDNFLWKIFEQLFAQLSDNTELHIGFVQTNGFKCYDLLFEAVQIFQMDSVPYATPELWNNVNEANSRHESKINDIAVSYQTQPFMSNTTRHWYRCRVDDVDELTEIMQYCDHIRHQLNFPLAHDVMSIKVVDTSSVEDSSVPHYEEKELILVDLVRLQQQGSSGADSSQTIADTTPLNMSLAVLSKALRDVSSRQQYVGYRDNAITKLLEPCLSTDQCLVCIDIDTSVDLKPQTKEAIHFGLNAVNLSGTEILRPEHAYLPQLADHNSSSDSLLSSQNINKLKNGKRKFAFPSTSSAPRPSTSLHKRRRNVSAHLENTSGEESAQHVGEHAPTDRPSTVAQGMSRNSVPKRRRKRSQASSMSESRSRDPEPHASETIDLGSLAYTLPTNADLKIVNEDKANHHNEPYVVNMRRPKSVQQFRKRQQSLRAKHRSRIESDNSETIPSAPPSSRDARSQSSYQASRTPAPSTKRRKKRAPPTNPHDKDLAESMNKLRKLQKAHEALNILAQGLTRMERRTESLFAMEAMAKTQFSSARNFQD